MRTFIAIAIGFAMFGLCIGAGWLVGGAAKMKLAALVFIGLWFIAAALNLYVGVTRAGYSFKEELPIFLLIFGAPAIIAAILRWKL